MSQTWVENDEGAAGDTVKTGLINLEDKHDTLQSNWSGATAPSSSLTVVGQTWHDTTASKLKILTTKSPSDTWKEIPVDGYTTFGPTWLATDAVETAKIAADAVTTAKIADDAVTAAKVADGAIGTVALAADAITEAKIADDAVKREHILDGEVLAAALATDAVETTKIKDLQVTSAKLGTAAVTAAKMATDAVETAKIKDAQVTAAKMKATGSTPFVFGKRSTDSVPVEVPITALGSGKGRLVKQLPETVTLGNNCMGVLTEDDEIWTIGYTTFASPAIASGRTYNRNWVPIIFDGAPGTISKFWLGGTSGYALDSNGDVWSWGYNHKGQLGHGNTTNLLVAKKISGLDAVTVTNLFVGNTRHANTYESVFALTDTGAVYAWGSNLGGQLGLGDNVDNYQTPQLVTALSNITDIVIGDSGLYTHCLALDSSGDVWSWGNNSNGNLGFGDTTNRITATKVTTLSSVDLIAAGGAGGGATMVSFAADGATLKACGYNGYGGLGVGDTAQKTSFTAATIAGSPGNIAAIETTGTFGCTVIRDAAGNLWSSGRNNDSQLALGDTADRNTFVAVTMPSTTASKHRLFASGGNGASLVFLGADGELYGSGKQENGVLSQGDTADVNGPTQFKRHGSDTLTDFVATDSLEWVNEHHGAIFALSDKGHLYASGELNSTGIGRLIPGPDSDADHLFLVPVPVL